MKSTTVAVDLAKSTFQIAVSKLFLLRGTLERVIGGRSKSRAIRASGLGRSWPQASPRPGTSPNSL